MYIHGHRIVSGKCAALTSVPSTLCPYSFAFLLHLVDTLNVCAAHPDPHLIELANSCNYATCRWKHTAEVDICITLNLLNDDLSDHQNSGYTACQTTDCALIVTRTTKPSLKRVVCKHCQHYRKPLSLKQQCKDASAKSMKARKPDTCLEQKRRNVQQS